MYRLKSKQNIQNKIKNKLRMKTINYACFKLEEKTTSVKKNKNNLINVIRNILAKSISWANLTIHL